MHAPGLLLLFRRFAATVGGRFAAGPFAARLLVCFVLAIINIIRFLEVFFLQNIGFVANEEGSGGFYT